MTAITHPDETEQTRTTPVGSMLVVHVAVSMVLWVLLLVVLRTFLLG